MFTHLDESDMYYNSGSRRNKVLSAILGCNNVKVRRDGYARKVKCKRMFLLIIISILSVSFALFGIWKTTSKSDKDAWGKGRCHVSPYYEHLYNYRGQASPYSAYLLVQNVSFGEKGKHPLKVELQPLHFSLKVEQHSMKLNIDPEEEKLNEKRFKSGLTISELDSMFTTFHHFSMALKKANVTYMLYGGTLIGAHRHHTMIPWDDDIDVLVNGSQKEAMSRALESLPEYTLYRPPLVQWKFFLKNTTRSKIPFAWPYIDIFFFGENETHIWDKANRYTQLYMFRKVDVFPLQYKPYQGSLQPVPCNSPRVLSRTYDPSLCTTSSYTHKEERSKEPGSRRTVKCESLYRKFPFVFRETRDNHVIETVKVGDCILYQTKASLPCLTESP
ncbi:uncharacterized protein [Argopecten irradians]|uniref:uncharacterized protein n=1 Tax=Argopecten irradians TaxID=31199 RepID=UPI003720E2AA